MSINKVLWALAILLPVGMALAIGFTLLFMDDTQEHVFFLEDKETSLSYGTVSYGTGVVFVDDNIETCHEAKKIIIREGDWSGEVTFISLLSRTDCPYGAINRVKIKLQSIKAGRH